MSLSIGSESSPMMIDSVVESTPSTNASLPSTAAVAATTAATTTTSATTTTTTTTAAAAAATTTTSTTTTPTAVALATAPAAPAAPLPTIRILVDTSNLPRHIIVNYRPSYKRELKKVQERDQTNATVPQLAESTSSAAAFGGVVGLNSADDDFYKELLKKAEAYNVDDDDVNDDGSDEENPGNEPKRRDDYDFEDPFIDDSDMLMDEPMDYSAPEYDGFFVWHGPLDGHDTSNTDKKASTSSTATSATTKRRTTAKSKASGTNASTATKKDSGSGASGTAGNEKSRKKASAATDESTDDKKKTGTSAAAAASTGNAASTATAATATKSKKTASIPAPAASGSTSVKKATATPDKSSKKRAKLDHNPTKEDESIHKSIASSPALSTAGSTDDASAHASSSNTADKSKKKLGGVPANLKPLDPEIEVLMEKLRHDVKAESFTNKAKFPASLKPTVLEAGLITFRKHKTVDDNLVYHLMSILPYNKFTLKKFLTTKSGQLRVDELQQEIDELAILLKQTIDRMMPEQQRLFNEKVAQAQASNDPASQEEQTPKFKCNDEVRKILYEIIQSEEQSIFIANQVATHKDSEKKAEGLASDGKARKLMYQRLLSCWPEGWMVSYEMSRQYSQYKSKVASMSEKKNTNPSLPTTPKANISTVESKKRKRTTPTNSNGEVTRKKQPTIAADIAQPPTAAVPATSDAQAPRVVPINVITIDDDSDDLQQPSLSSWKQSNSMKIEALISGPNTEKKE